MRHAAHAAVTEVAAVHRAHGGAGAAIMRTDAILEGRQVKAILRLCAL